MRFTTTAIFFGMTSAAIAGTAIAAPGSEIKGSYKAVQMTEGFFPGDPNASCYCCPSSGSGSNCGLVNEDGRCQNGDVLICCDLREQVSVFRVAYYS